MKKAMCVVMVMGLFVSSGLASRFARSDDEKTYTIKEVMQKLHKGSNSALAKLKKDLAKETPDWAEIQARAKEFETYGESLPKNDPPRGEKEDFKKLADSYYENAKKLNSAAKKEDKADVQASFKKIQNACKTCHTAAQAQLMTTRLRARRPARLGGGHGVEHWARVVASSAAPVDPGERNIGYGQPQHAADRRPPLGGTPLQQPVTRHCLPHLGVVPFVGRHHRCRVIPADGSSEALEQRQEAAAVVPVGREGSNARTGRIAWSALCHHASAVSRTESSTIASGFASLNSRQNIDAGQSTAATYPSISSAQSGFSPATARSQPTPRLKGWPGITFMW